MRREEWTTIIRSITTLNSSFDIIQVDDAPAHYRHIFRPAIRLENHDNVNSDLYTDCIDFIMYRQSTSKQSNAGTIAAA